MCSSSTLCRPAHSTCHRFRPDSSSCARAFDLFASLNCDSLGCSDSPLPLRLCLLGCTRDMYSGHLWRGFSSCMCTVRRSVILTASLSFAAITKADKSHKSTASTMNAYGNTARTFSSSLRPASRLCLDMLRSHRLADSILGLTCAMRVCT